MPRTREQFAQMKDVRVESIFKAALPLFALNGQKVSVDAIAKKAGCSHGIIYHYFRNSDEIYECLLTSKKFKELQTSLMENLEGSSYEKIEHIFAILLNVNAKDIETVSYCYILTKMTGKTSLFALLTTLFKNAQSSRLIVGGEPKELINCLFTLLKGIYLPLLTEKHPDIQVPSIETIMQLIRKQEVF